MAEAGVEGGLDADFLGAGGGGRGEGTEEGEGVRGWWGSDAGYWGTLARQRRQRRRCLLHNMRQDHCVPCSLFIALPQNDLRCLDWRGLEGY